MVPIEWTKEDAEILKRACRYFYVRRKRTRRSLKMVAAEAHISTEMLKSIEQGRFQEVDLKSFYRLCRYYYVLPHQLLTGSFHTDSYSDAIFREIKEK
jgi:hypothetical protein